MATHGENIKADVVQIETSDHVDATQAEQNIKARHHVNTQMDDAAALLEAAGGQFEITPEDRKRILRKVDLWVCLPMCIVYMIQSLDKGSISYAAVFDLSSGGHLHGSEYSWLSSVGYFAQLVFQSTSAYALVVFPVKYWVLFNMTAWSIVTICTAAATDFAGLLTARIFLGVFEATILPSFVLITQMWWTRREQSYRTIAYQISLSVAGIFGPLMSFGVGEGIAHTNSKIYTYQGIFLFLGGVSLAFVPLIWYLLPNSPTTAKFLANGNDRLIAIERIRENNTGTKASKWKWEQFWEAMRDPKTWMWTAMFLCVSCPSGGVGTFGGLITKGFGFDSLDTILMQIPTGVIGIIIELAAIFIINKIKCRFIVICVMIIPAVGGAIGLIYLPRANIRGLMGCYYTMYFYPALQPLLYSWANLNAAGTTKRVVTTASLFVGQCVGNIVGPQVYLAREAPYYHTGLYVDIGCWCMLGVLSFSMGMYLRYLNQKQAKKRLTLGLPEHLEDMSIMTTEEAARYRETLTLKLREQGMDEKLLYENAFDDMTDFQNPTFAYVW